MAADTAAAGADERVDHGPHDAPEADVTGRGVDRLREPRGRPVAPAVVRRAQVRSALEHLAGDSYLRLARIVAVLQPRPARIRRDAARLDRIRGCLGVIPVRRPLPHVADHVVEPVAVGRECARPATSVRSRPAQVLPRKLALPRVGHLALVAEELVAPRIRGAVQSAARGELPLRLRRQRLAFPAGERLGIAVRRRARPGAVRVRRASCPDHTAAASRRRVTHATSS